MKELRLHLWDIFVYIGVGALVAGLYVAHETVLHPENLLNAIALGKEIPASVAFILVTALLMLIGALVEPLANQFEKIIFRAVGSKRAMKTPLEIFIARTFTDPILGEGQSPYALCKEFVETKGLRTTFMPFLSKFGFYRSASFCFFLFGVWLAISAFIEGSASLSRMLAIAVTCGASWIYMHRGRQFLSYQAPSIYHAFLIPYLEERLAPPKQVAQQDAR